MRTLLLTLTFAGASLCTASSSIAASPYPATETFGVPFSKDEFWYRQCMRVEHRSMPAPAGQAASGCKASAAYYLKRGQAVTSDAEWARVRACAVAEHDNAVLMMLYANGFGVPRDTDMAIHYACSLDFVAKAEMESRIRHLADALPSDKVFDQCDDITSGHMGAICAGIRESQAQRVREARLNRAVWALAGDAQAAFKTLRSAAEAYIGAGAAEVDMQGTGAPGFAVEHEGRLREQFMQAALDVLGNKPLSAPSGMDRLDAALNAVYQRLMTAPSTQEGWPDRIGTSTIERSKVRTAERRWLAYRDAFLSFATALHPGTGPAALAAFLTAQRLVALNGIALYL